MTDIYTDDIELAHLKNPDVAFNTVMWRLAIAAGFVKKGDGVARVNWNELLEYVERYLENGH